MVSLPVWVKKITGQGFGRPTHYYPLENNNQPRRENQSPVIFIFIWKILMMK